MGLDVNIYMVKNYKQLEDENFLENCPSTWIKDEYGEVDYTKPCQVYYARKFWPLYTKAERILHIRNGEVSAPLTKKDLEELINVAVHYRDFFDSFDSVPQLCEILDRYNEATNAGMIFVFEGDY